MKITSSIKMFVMFACAITFVSVMDAKIRPVQVQKASVEKPSPVASRPIPKPETDVFPIKGRFIPSGWMGDFSSIKYNASFPEGTKKVIKITYTGERKQEAGWTGIYWQSPSNNWGSAKGGYDLTHYNFLKFKARTDTAGALIDKFQMGGISGGTEEGDSDQASIEQIELTKEWKQYSIDLRGIDKSHIIGGFCFVVNADINEKGATFYLDDIRYEK